MFNATIANLIGHIGLSSPVHQYQEKKRRLRLLFLAIFRDDRRVFLVKIPTVNLKTFSGVGEAPPKLRVAGRLSKKLGKGSPHPA